MDPATTPPVGTRQGQAMPLAGTPAPQGHPSLLLWENVLLSGCWDKDEKGRGFLEGRAAGTVWGNTRQGLCSDKSPSRSRGARGPQRQRELGGACSCSPQHSKSTFYPERRLPGLGGAGGQPGLVSPRPLLHPLGGAGCDPSVLGVLLTSSLAHSRELASTLCQTPLPLRLCRCLPGSVPAALPG